MRKSIPNILTISRIIMVPVFAFLFFQEKFLPQFLSLILFVLAILSDYYDGRLARKYKVESNLGRFLDPLADKLLVLTAYSCFVFIPDYKIPFWIIIIILFRELSLTGLRMLAISQGKTLKTSKLGKLKTATQMFTIIIIILLMLFKTFMIENQYVKFAHFVKGEKFWSFFVGNFWGNLISYAPLILIIMSVFITLYSGVMYIIVNKDLFKNLKKT